MFPQHSIKALHRLAAAAALAAIALPALPNFAHAVPVTTTVTFSPTGLPGATGAVSSIDLTGDVGKTSFTVNTGANAVAVTTANGGGVVQGSVANAYAAPVTGGTIANPTYVTGPYLSTGGTPGTITLSFASLQSYFGLLWGSVGSGDYLTFLNHGTVIATVTGTQVMQAAAGFNSSSGAQGYGGSQYTLVNLIGGQFDSVILGQTGDPSFEASSFQYAAQNISVPEPASMALLSLGLAGTVALRRRKPAV